MKYKGLVFICCVLLAATSSWAQDRGSSPSSGSTSSNTSAAPAPSSGDRGSSSVSGAASIGTSSGVGNAGFSSANNRGYYGGYYLPSMGMDYYRLVDFLYLLQSRYLFLPTDFYLRRYVNGEPLLTAGLVEMALRDSSVYSNHLLRLTVELDDVVSGLLAKRSSDPATDKKRAKELLSEIRKISKKIKADQFLEYLDTRENDEPLAISSRKAGIEEKLAELQSFAQQLRAELERLKNDEPTVVDVRTLSKPSVRSLSRSIESLASGLNSDLKKIG